MVFKCIRYLGIFILVDLEDLVGINSQGTRELLVNMLAVAIMLIASKWKSPTVPTINEWLSKIRYMAIMAKISAICIYRVGQMSALTEFNRHWEPFICSKYSHFSQGDEPTYIC